MPLDRNGNAIENSSKGEDFARIAMSTPALNSSTPTVIVDQMTPRLMAAPQSVYFGRTSFCRVGGKQQNCYVCVMTT